MEFPLEADFRVMVNVYNIHPPSTDGLGGGGAVFEEGAYARLLDW